MPKQTVTSIAARAAACALAALLAFPRAATAQPRSAGELTIAAAADLTLAFRKLAPAFTAQTGVRVRLVLGSTGLLARQAERGAPFDALFAANESYVDTLERKGKLVPNSRRLYALGRLVVWTRPGAPHPAGIEGLRGNPFRRIAIAQPEHAPYGMAAREALRGAGLWEDLKGRIVYGGNVQQALQFTQTGNAQAAIVALSVTIGQGGKVTEIAPSLYRPIRQAAAVLRTSRRPAAAIRFIEYVTGEQGRALLAEYGFSLPQRAGSRSDRTSGARHPLPPRR